jgi:predicted Mrr-cat superfamily restriction endonuclease
VKVFQVKKCKDSCRVFKDSRNIGWQKTGSFKGTVQKELAASFFRVRLWTQKELLEALFEHFDRLDEDIKAELPIKRIWIVASQEEE